MVCSRWDDRKPEGHDYEMIPCAGCGDPLAALVSNRARIVKERMALFCAECAEEIIKYRQSIGAETEYCGRLKGGRSDIERAQDN